MKQRELTLAFVLLLVFWLSMGLEMRASRIEAEIARNKPKLGVRCYVDAWNHGARCMQVVIEEGR